MMVDISISLEPEVVAFVVFCSKGIAIDQGIIGSISTNILDYFPEYNGHQMDSRKEKIILEHLLTQTSGFAYDEDKEIAEWLTGGKLSAEYEVLKRAMQSQLGERFNYDTPSVDLLSVILTKTAKQDTFSFAQDNLFRPLAIKDVECEKDPAGYYLGGTGMVRRPRDVAKLGQLYLQKGQWNGKQLVSEHWFAQSIIPRSQVIEEPGIVYGRLWWTRKTGNENVFFGLG